MSIQETQTSTCEVCNKEIKGSKYWNKETKQFECNDCYISKESKIK